jgi:hypothetical protein
MSNAIQLRDSSDVTTFHKNRALYQNYNQLKAKNQLPIGGISHNDFMGVARQNAMYIPTDSMIAIVTEQADCPICVNDVTYVTTEIVAVSCSEDCSSGPSYQPGVYQAFQNVKSS